ncbi:MAG: MarR family transcriptional regulator [Betaproteobacteria bacterium]|nr:MarR family transcriptional regulator [Betaproteobacteria bacterium]
MSRAIVVPVIRELARCYQAFQRASDAHIRLSGLTPPQFDIVVTLGNTDGMTFKELGSRTLITKGTLTGVVDRLEARGLVARAASPTDGRSTLVKLTPEGERLFQRVFEPHLAFLAPAFESLPECGRKELEKRLRQLRLALERRSHDLAGQE